jgi:quercetin dioxygenase-like cupin family protein
MLRSAANQIVEGETMSAIHNSPWITMVPGIRRQTIVAGERMMLMQVQLEAGSHLPEHHHPHEQLTHVLRGRLRMRVGDTTHELGPGDTICTPGNTPHAVDALEDTLVLDTFSPPREDLLAQDAQEAANRS